jgi:SAM-dependent methyltransferase
MDKGLKYLSDLTWSYRASRTLQTAVGLDLFTHLDPQPMAGPQLADALGARADMLEKLLIGCAAMGLVTKEDGRYANTPLSAAYLVRGRPLYHGDIIAHAAGVWEFWDQLPKTVSVDPPRRLTDADEHRNFILGMHNITMAGRGQLFLDSIDLSGRKHLFDVGGGPGTYSILACRKYPELKATVFDLPETTAIAQKMIAAEGMQDRVFVRPGDWNTDDFGRGNDVVLFSNVLHGPNSQAAMKLKKAYDSMTPGGLLVIQEFLLNDEKTGPLIPALFNIMVGAYSRAELFEAVQQSGFIQIKLTAAAEEFGASWVTARKP